MSNVELPLVPSARSTSASSSRSSLRSASSDRSAKSTRSRSSLGADDDRDVMTQQEDDDGQEDEEEPQESSGGLWDEVESFLNKPSPSLSALAKSSKKPPPAAASTKNGVLPNLKAEVPRRTSQGDNQSAVRPSRPTRVAAAGSKSIDPTLLQEAFAYARKVQAQMMNDDDDQDEDDAAMGGRAKAPRRHAPDLSHCQDFGSSSSLLSGSGASRPSGNARGSAPRGKPRDPDKPKKKPSSSSNSAYGGAATRKKGSDKRGKEPSTQWNGDEAGGGIGGNGDERKSKKANMDAQTLQELVTNFQNGTALEELRKELAASQQSLAFSRQVLHDAAKSFFQPS